MFVFAASFHSAAVLILGVAFVLWAVRLNRYARERKEKLIEETRLYQTKQKYLKH
jgi:hypothetical protein